jgi:hypothetical protein
LADELHFVSVFGPPIEGADAYLDAMSRLGARQTILKCLAEYDEVACFYELSLPARPDVGLFGCGWFTIGSDRIKSVRVVFDPNTARQSLTKCLLLSSQPAPTAARHYG